MISLPFLRRTLVRPIEAGVLASENSPLSPIKLILVVSPPKFSLKNSVKLRMLANFATLSLLFVPHKIAQLSVMDMSMSTSRQQKPPTV